MIPENWHSDFVYAKESRISPEHAWLISLCLSSSQQDILDYESHLLVEKTVHSDLHVKLITDQLKYGGPIPHPLANTLTNRGYTQRGIFARKNIPKGTVLGEYVGEISLVNQPENIVSEYGWAVKIGDFYLFIDPEKCANELALVNDYRGLQPLPNAKGVWIRHQGLLYFVYMTTSEVEEGQELLVDYGESYWKRP